MARLIGVKPDISFTTAPVMHFFEFAMTRLPDYIYAVFDATFITRNPEHPDAEETGSKATGPIVDFIPRNHDGTYDFEAIALSQDEFDEAIREKRVLECDSVLLIPHLGVFVLDLYSGTALRHENGRSSMNDRAGHRFNVDLDKRRDQQIMKRRMIRRYFQQKHRYTPLVYEVACYPHFAPAASLQELSGLPFDPDHVIWGHDLFDESTFLAKLHSWMLLEREREMESAQNLHFFDDLSDRDAYSIYRTWGKITEDYTRPEKPPMIFMSYKSLNRVRALEIKDQLEERGVFVWNMSDDICISEDYLVTEMQAIADCDAFMILLSRASQESDEVRLEFDEAIRLNKRIIPLLIEEFELNDYYVRGLTHSQYKVMIEDSDRILDEIVSVVKR